MQTVLSIGLSGVLGRRAGEWMPCPGFVLIGLLAMLTSIAGVSSEAATYSASTTKPPKVMHEYRGAWVASVGNIDWPSSPNLSSAEQKAELTAILDKAADLKLNVVILQVRPACDALYASSIEPWSAFLTGTMGKGPEPYYDPLAFAIDEAHRRGLELHAWFNPYRARVGTSRNSVSANHISRRQPSLVREYGNYLWLDPGEKEVQAYSLKVVMDVVQRYDVDGIHFDDYFYPYKVPGPGGGDLEFPDEASWRRFGAGGKLSRDDWRRENVNSFIQSVYKSTKAAKPWVKFGVSPFGIWRPGNPPQIQGHDAYAKLYADSRKWLANGWLDYFVPQLYWAIDPPDQSFPVLLKWWGQQNKRHRHLLPGLDSTKTRVSERRSRPGRTAWKPEEIVRQIRITRAQEGTSGHVHWNMGTLMRNQGLDAQLERDVYNEPALVPATPWLDKSAPTKPIVGATASGSITKVSWPRVNDVSRWVLQSSKNGKWTTEILAGRTTTQDIPGAPSEVALMAVDRYGNTSQPAVLRRKDN